jgi:hypothetical protein
MMAKIFGAVLIVSGSYLGGWLSTYRIKQRLKTIKEIGEFFSDFRKQLRDYRSSLEEVFDKYGTIGEKLAIQAPIRGLEESDLDRIYGSINHIKTAGFQASLEETERLLEYLDKVECQLSNDDKTKGKALPLTTGAIGLLVAILLI